jgi:RNA polymerase sigma-70 factor (ECF subfamily)
MASSADERRGRPVTATDARPERAATAAEDDKLISVLDESRQRFLALVGPIRPELHRYCTRMTGSAADGEDVVQETLASACYELAQMRELPPLRPWLFRIAHNHAIDHWRRESYRVAEPLEAAVAIAEDAAYEPDQALARRQAVNAALLCFLELPPVQRGCVVLKDVLEHSLDEIAAELNLTIPAVKAALYRGRAALLRLGGAPQGAKRVGTMSPELGRYARLFNARDWDAVRNLLADDVRLDLVSRRKLTGREAVGSYLGNYERASGWYLRLAWLDGAEVLAVTAHEGAHDASYFIVVGWHEGRVVTIRDFRYVGYILRDRQAELEPLPDHSGERDHES